MPMVVPVVSGRQGAIGHSVIFEYMVTIGRIFAILSLAIVSLADPLAVLAATHRRSAECQRAVRVGLAINGYRELIMPSAWPNL